MFRYFINQPSRRDTWLVTVESQNDDFTHLWTGGSVLKLYQVGRSRSTGVDEDEEDDDDEEEDGEDDGDDGEDDDDDTDLDDDGWFIDFVDKFKIL